MTYAAKPELRIGIVGGGPGGLVLAGVLARAGVRATVLERDASPAARTQGGCLDLHPESGQRALVAAGLIGQFRQHVRPQGEEHRILDPQGREHVHHQGAADPEPGEPGQPGQPGPDGIVPGRPEIDRSALRELLLDPLPAGTVRWDSHVTGIEPIAGGGHRTRLADGTTADWDVLVGADGARSRVRPLLTPAKPEPLGITSATMSLRDLTGKPALAGLIGHGTLWCLGADLIVGAQRSGEDAARVSVLTRETLPPKATKASLLGLIRDWSPVIKDLVTEAEEPVEVYELKALPADLTWPSRPGITLIGDAAHLMPPVGEGANQAMLDGAELAAALLAASGDPAKAIQEAERAMFARVHPVAKQSLKIQAMILSPDALAHMTRMFTRQPADK